jgi:hypothetical protein
MKARADAFLSSLLVVAAVEIRGSCKVRYKVNAQGKSMHVTEVIALKWALGPVIRISSMTLKAWPEDQAGTDNSTLELIRVSGENDW